MPLRVVPSPTGLPSKQQGYHSLDRKDVAIVDYIHNGLKLIMSCPSVLDLFSLLQVEVLRMVCERPEPQLCARLSDLLTDFVQCIPKGLSMDAKLLPWVRGQLPTMYTEIKRLRVQLWVNWSNWSAYTLLLGNKMVRSP